MKNVAGLACFPTTFSIQIFLGFFLKLKPSAVCNARGLKLGYNDVLNIFFPFLAFFNPLLPKSEFRFYSI